jgi:hypothetical protein
VLPPSSKIDVQRQLFLSTKFCRKLLQLNGPSNAIVLGLDYDPQSGGGGKRG